MKPRKHLSVATFSVMLIAALIAACGNLPAAPPVTPVPSTPTAISPASTPVPSTPAPTSVTTAPKTTAAVEPQPQPHQPRPDAPPYAARGPYAVGVRDFVIDTPERQIPVSVWYPALNTEGAEETVLYTLGFPTNANPDFTIAGRALVDAAPDLSGGPYPLVIHSHGGWSFRQEAAYLVEHLASHGFVVMAAGHEDNWGILLEDQLYKSEISRSKDIARELDFAGELTAANGALAGLIDTEQVAVSGWREYPATTKPA